MLYELSKLKIFSSSRKKTTMESQKSHENNDRKVAWTILSALCDSSLADEFDHYYKDIQEDLKIPDDQMTRVFNLHAICRLLTPEEPRVRTYKGRQVKPKFSFDSWQPVCSGGVCRLPSRHTSSEDYGTVASRVAALEASAGVVPSREPCSALGTVDLHDLDDNHVVETRAEEKCTESHAEEAHAEEAHAEEAHAEEAHAEEAHAEEAHAEEAHAEEAHAEEAHAEEEQTSRSSSGDKNKHPAAKAMRKLLRTVGIPLEGLTLDTEKYDKALIIFGNTKPHRDSLNTLGGKWNGRLSGWVFSKQKLTSAMEKAQQLTEEQQEHQE
jgi:chemotaxis protein histidine kinase CheA